jgi:hemerythrin-like domain-containing protein
MPALLERLGRDHARIAGVIRELARRVDDVTDVAMDPDWDRLDELIGFLDYYADRVHHPLEDRVFDHLVNKGLTPAERRLVFKNLNQHEEIKAMTEGLSRQVVDAQKGHVVDVQSLIEDVSRYVALQQRHMRFEDEQLFPLLDQAFDNSDWNALAGPLEVPEQDFAVLGDQMNKTLLEDR